MNAYANLASARVESADPLELVALLYSGALDSIREARRQLRAGDIEARGRAVSRATAILMELATSLDHQRGGDLSRRLAELYLYMLERLAEAHSRQQDAPLAEVESLLATLEEGWRRCEVQSVSSPARQRYTAEADVERISCVA